MDRAAVNHVYLMNVDILPADEAAQDICAVPKRLAQVGMLRSPRLTPKQCRPP